MAEVEIKSNIKLGLTEILEGISKLEIDELELFLKEVSGILAQKKNKTTTKREATLLKKIKSDYPEKLKKQYQLLHSKMESGEITEKEQKELIELSDQFEAMDAKRLQYLLELSELRGQPLNLILKEFPSSSAYA